MLIKISTWGPSISSTSSPLPLPYSRSRCIQFRTLRHLGMGSYPIIVPSKSKNANFPKSDLVIFTRVRSPTTRHVRNSSHPHFSRQSEHDAVAFSCALYRSKLGKSSPSSDDCFVISYEAHLGAIPFMHRHSQCAVAVPTIHSRLSSDSQPCSRTHPRPIQTQSEFLSTVTE